MFKFCLSTILILSVSVGCFESYSEEHETEICNGIFCCHEIECVTNCMSTTNSSGRPFSGQCILIGETPVCHCF